MRCSRIGARVVALFGGLVLAACSTRGAPVEHGTRADAPRRAALRADTSPRAADALRVDGDVASVRDFTRDELAALGTTRMTWGSAQNGHDYVVVPLEKVLAAAGVDAGPMHAERAADKRAGWKYVVVGTAIDGFQAVFSAAEVSSAMGPTQVFVAIGTPEGPLPAEAGPYRLLVPTDKERSRCARNLTTLTLVDLRRFVPGAAGE